MDKAVPGWAASNASSQHSPLLSDDEADRRSLLLWELQVALGDLGVQAVVAGHHRLVLNSASGSCGYKGRTDPRLHIFAPDGITVKAAATTVEYQLLDDGSEYPVNDPGAAADAICRRHSRAPVPA